MASSLTTRPGLRSTFVMKPRSQWGQCSHSGGPSTISMASSIVTRASQSGVVAWYGRWAKGHFLVEHLARFGVGLVEDEAALARVRHAEVYAARPTTLARDYP